MDPSSSSSDSAPDCWDQVDMQALGLAPIGHRASVAGAEAQCEPLSSAFSHQLNVNAKPFVPNVHAAEFVPFFLRGPAQTQTPSADTTGTDELCSGAGDPQGKRLGRGATVLHRRKFFKNLNESNNFM